MRRLAPLSLVAALLTVGALTAPAAQAEATSTVTNGCAQSVPDPGTTGPVAICYTIFQPPGASKLNPVPMVMTSHGWGGSRATEPSTVQYLLDAGFGVLSFDQRGFGESGGHAYIENPDVEGKDVQKMEDVVTALPWSKKVKGDPVLGAVGGSYGGGFQFVGAFSELRDKGYTRFDALVPEITWNSLTESLFPSGVPRTEWATVLTAAAVPSDALPQPVIDGFAQAVATGEVPQSLYDFMKKNGPSYHVAQGRKLNIPVLFGQGETDNLFPLREGFLNFQTALTDKARAKSIFLGANGGHALPSLFPLGTFTPAGDPCSIALGSPDFQALALRFLQQNLQGKNTGLTGFGSYHLATEAGDRCVHVPAVSPNTAMSAPDLITTVGVGGPQSVQIASGPLTIAGSPTLDAKVTTFGLGDNRVFLSLSVGTSPSDAHIVQNNMLPLRETGLVTDKTRSGVQLPAIAVDVPAGQNLYLTVSPISDMSSGFGSRIFGAMMLKNLVVHAPVVR